MADLPSKGELHAPETIKNHARVIESYLTSYCRIDATCNVELFIQRFPEEFLRISCPDALNLPAAFITNETGEEAFIGIHINDELSQTLSAHASLSNLLSYREGLNAFMILAEEISHFSHYVSSAEKNIKISRFDLELQAEIEKVVVGSLALIDTFGKAHTRELIHILFNECVIEGTLTDYTRASKLAEKFWKENVKKVGPDIVFDARIRKIIQSVALRQGEDKVKFLERSLKSA